jgi:hypothetical protein
LINACIYACNKRSVLGNVCRTQQQAEGSKDRPARNRPPPPPAPVAWPLKERNQHPLHLTNDSDELGPVTKVADFNI